MSASSRWGRCLTILLSGLVVGCFQLLALAQVGSAAYDLSTETKMKGTVEEMKLPPKGNKEAAHLLLKTGEVTVDVYLCPRSFLEDMGSDLAKGDEVAITGSKVKGGEGEEVLAREVVKGQDTLVLRDDKGKPVWNWRK
jgi:hypothetical protein